MSIYSDTVNGVLFLRPGHDVDFKVGKEIRDRLAIATNDGVFHVIIDFSLATLVSAATLRIILDAANRIQRHRGCIVVTGASPQFGSLLAISDVLKIVPAFALIAEGQAHLQTFMSERNATLTDEEDEPDN